MRQSEAPDTPVERLAVRKVIAGQMLDCSPVTIWRMVKAGKLVAVKVGTEDRVTVESIKRLAQAA